MTSFSRRAFVQSMPLAVATLVRCTNTLAPRSRVAEAFIVDPSWEAYRPALAAVITAVLPFEAPGFPPIAPADVEQRLIRLFPLEQELRFLGLQRTIVLFDQLDLYREFSGPLAQEESKARDFAARGGDEARTMREIRAADAASFAAFARERHFDATPPRFRDLDLQSRRAYMHLWQNSASVVKRQFYGALRSLVMITTYSMEATWPSIGYDGPLVPRTVAES